MLTAETIAVNVLLVLGLALFSADAPARKTWARAGVVGLMYLMTGFYLHWRVTRTLPEFGWTPASLWPWVFFGFELLAIAYEVWSLFVLVKISNHSPQADVYERRLRAAPALPTIDVFIPSYSEGPDILEGTLRAALALDYPRHLVTVCVLDDGNRPWLAALARSYGVAYFARPSNEHGKAGNLNYALPRTEGEYVVVIDADFQLEKNFLYRTLGFLVYEGDISIVQTPQHFRNPDPIQHNLFGARAWTEEQHFFMTMVQSGRDAHNNAFCVGSGWLVRRADLVELGGFPQQSLCEDLEISYVLRAQGKRTLFLNERLAVGLAPESLPEYIKQRVRWCSGTMQHLYLSSGPIRAAGLTLRDRLFYFEPILYWLTFPFIVLLMLAPVIWWLSGVAALQGRGDDLFLVLIPRFLASYLILWWISEGKVIPTVTMIHKTLPAFHLTLALAKALLLPFGSPFKVTDKGQNRAAVVVQWQLLGLFAGLGMLLFAGMWINLTGFYRIVPVHDITLLDVGWSLYSLGVLVLCALACVELPKDEGYAHAAADVTQGSLKKTCLALAQRLIGGRNAGP